MQTLEERTEEHGTIIIGAISALVGVVATRYLLHKCGIDYQGLGLSASVLVGAATGYAGMRYKSMTDHFMDGQ